MDFASATVNVNVDVAAREILLEFSGVKSHPEASDSHDIRLELGKIAFVAWSCAEIPGAGDTVKRFCLRPPAEFWLTHQPLVPEEFRWARNYKEEAAADSIYNLWEVLLEFPTYRLQVLCDDWGSPSLSSKLDSDEEQ